MTTIYLIRHSRPMKVKPLNDSDHVQIQNEKAILSVEGEQRAKILSEQSEFRNVDCVISSNYVRAIATAKYIASKNDLDIFVNENFRERKQGVNSWEELPKDFEIKQFKDDDYKIGNGESLKEVRERMLNALFNVLNEYENKKVVIVSHGTAMMSLFKTWCEASFENNWKLKFNDSVIFDDIVNAPEVFKLVFNESELISIENIRFKELN